MKRMIKSTVGYNSYTANDVIRYLVRKEYVASEELKQYAHTVADYINDMNEAAGDGVDTNYTLDDWYKDTMSNYSEGLSGFERFLD